MWRWYGGVFTLVLIRVDRIIRYYGYIVVATNIPALSCFNVAINLDN